MHISRRHFLKQAGAIALGFTGLQTFMECATPGELINRGTSSGFGPLRSDPAQILDLPEGFAYNIISRFGDRMDDGFYVPHRPDGMATFASSGNKTILIRNHEINSDALLTESPFGSQNELFGKIDKRSMYDTGSGEHPCMGGTSTVVYDTKAKTIKQQYLSLSGTLRNCAGGPTPWNSWLSCEETVEKANDTLQEDHGWVFEVPAHSTPNLVNPAPIKQMGRFNHEAVAVDPNSGVVYLTEDRHDGLIYRFIPDSPGSLHKGGKLQALQLKDHKSADTRNWDETVFQQGTKLAVSWIDLDDIVSPEDDLRMRGFDSGAARFARGEGMWYGQDAVYFACTNGGLNKKGQIWRYTPSVREGQLEEIRSPGILELFVEPNDTTLIENADNLTVSPWGDLIVCEDGSGEQYLVGITPKGEFYKFGRNAVNNSELAGATFSPDSSTLFVNIQTAGLTIAITGPWRGIA